jgi:hypothetical protein
MNTTKTLFLAAVTALFLGAGAAMAQSEVPSAAPMTYVPGQGQVAPWSVDTWSGRGSSRVQSGSSDQGATHSTTHFVPFNGDYTTLDNPG